MQLAFRNATLRPPSHRQADRHARAILHEMRGLHRHMDRIPRQQLHRRPAPAKMLLPIQIAMPARMKCLALHSGHQLLITSRKDRHDLFAHDLEQNIMLRVHVKRRHAARR